MGKLQLCFLLPCLIVTGTAAGRLAYISEGDRGHEIILYDLETGVVAPLLDNETDEDDPLWSPTGDRLACITDAFGYDDLGVLSVATAELTLPSELDGRHLEAAWSPDGAWLVFACDCDDNDADEVAHAGWMPDYELFVVSVQGGQARRLTDNERLSDRSPAWSPDGAWIAYNAEEAFSRSDSASHIYLVAAAGGEPRRLTDGAVHYWEPRWSPDGGRLLYTGAAPRPAHAMQTDLVFDGQTVEVDYNTDMDLYLYDLDAERQLALTENRLDDFNPRWSPDGSRIAFVRNEDDNTDIWLMDADGGNPTPLTDGPAWEDTPAWSPDGTQLAFVSYDGGDQEICVIDVEGAELRRITDNDVNDHSPTWRPE
jgi:Tol biopolymer transport system component